MVRQSFGRLRPGCHQPLYVANRRASSTEAFVATPDHWHAPAAILACEAGKHVYVEKPCSHNLRESRLLLDAARRNQVVVQHGTQQRSAPFTRKAMRMLHEGIIGDVLVAKAWNIQRRPNIGHMQPGDPPPEVDYDLWVGPAKFLPFQKNRFHYSWHWWYKPAFVVIVGARGQRRNIGDQPCKPPTCVGVSVLCRFSEY